MVASIGKIASPSQGASYYERDGYYARDDPAHREASAWAGRGAAALGLSGPVDPAAFTAILEGKVPGGRQLGRRDRDGNIQHRPGRDVTLSAPKSVSLLALVGGDTRVVAAHDEAVGRTLAWIEKNAIETRMRDLAGGGMIRASGQKTVTATFRHDTSRNLDPQLHTHCVIANMVQGGDGKWRTMVDDGLYGGKMTIGAIYRAELAQGLSGLGYRIEKTHADGRFEVAGVPRAVIEAFSTRRAEIEAAERAVAELERRGGLHAATGHDRGRFWTTDAAIARESETLSLMRAGQGAGVEVVEKALRFGGALGPRQAVVDDLLPAVGTQAEDYRHRALEGAGAGLAAEHHAHQGLVAIGQRAASLDRRVQGHPADGCRRNRAAEQRQQGLVDLAGGQHKAGQDRAVDLRSAPGVAPDHGDGTAGARDLQLDSSLSRLRRQAPLRRSDAAAPSRLPSHRSTSSATISARARRGR